MNSPFNPSASYGEESAVRFIINTSVEEGKASIKRCEDLSLSRSLRRSLK